MAAREIMALVDEFPSGPFSLERREIESKLEDLIAKLHDIHEDAKESYYQLGYDDGMTSGVEQSEIEIQELEDKITDLESEVEEAFDKGYDEGYDRALAERNSN